MNNTQKAQRYPVQTEQSVQRKVGQLRELGVEFVFGSDEGTFGQTATQATRRELEVWVRHLGLQPMDVIAVLGDPSRSIEALRDPTEAALDKRLNVLEKLPRQLRRPAQAVVEAVGPVNVAE